MSGYSIFSVGHDGKLFIWEIPETDSKVYLENLERIVKYPNKNQQNTIEPVFELKVSSEPLSAVAVHSNCFFVCDFIGNVFHWGKTS